MNYESEGTGGESKFFRASKIWTANVCGAAVGGMVAGAVMLIIAVRILWASPEIKDSFIGAAWLLVIFASLWGMYPGNWIASAPYTVQLVKGRGLWLYAFLKKVYLPLDEVVEINESLLGTRTVITLRKHHGLLKSFWIPWAYGEQGRALVLEIRKEIARRG
jgi:hypothetical protein